MGNDSKWTFATRTITVSVRFLVVVSGVASCKSTIRAFRPITELAKINDWTLLTVMVFETNVTTPYEPAGQSWVVVGTTWKYFRTHGCASRSRKTRDETSWSRMQHGSGCLPSSVSMTSFWRWEIAQAKRDSTSDDAKSMFHVTSWIVEGGFLVL